ncbi:alpha/beta hydrolase [Novosphingobium aquimarinum]|uniref:alpha/beta hydrolase n=1 Tax=Novosphingobium aquimarinum TaxID=2682494 RepID=UPI0012EB622E|nr:alpha/beta hydrolase fold domain-containing protein [Novosphingobium aquimarinum]
MNDAADLPEGIAEYLDAVAAMRADGGSSPEGQRLVADREAWRLGIARPAGMRVTDTYVVGGGAETPVRLYRPQAASGAGLVYFHGGGFTSGSIETFDCLAMGLAEASGTLIISVGYRRLPEASPREIVEEGAKVFEWALRNCQLLGFEADGLGLAGDSAGAFIATMLALGPLRSQPIACLALIYGLFDCDPASMPDELGAGSVLSPAVLKAILETFAECDRRDPLDGPPPLRTPDLSALPPTVMLHAEACPFYEQGVEFAARLTDAGVPVHTATAARMPHGFLRALRFSEPTRGEMRALGEAIRNTIATTEHSS